MTFPTSSTALVPVVQDSDGALAEAYAVPGSAPYTHRLGANLAQPYPSTWQLLPKGAFPITPPGAPSAGALVSETGGLTSNGAYSWALTNVTANGETTSGTLYTVGAIGAGTSYKFALPTASQGTPDAPIVARRLYRTTNGGSTLGFVAEIRDLALTHYVDKTPDADLGDAPPSTNGSGLPQTVTLTGSSQTWTERAPGATLGAGDFIVDYSKSPTGGVITHSAADAGKSVSASYTASTYLTSSFIGALITAVKETGAAVGAASGLATLDVNGRVVQASAHGIHYDYPQDLLTDQNSMSGTSWTNFPGFNTFYLNGFQGGNVRAVVGGCVYQGGTGGGPTLFNVGISVDGGTVQNVGGGVANPGNNGVIYGEKALGTLSGNHTFQLVYAVASGAWSCRPLTQTPEGMHLTIKEYF